MAQKISLILNNNKRQVLPPFNKFFDENFGTFSNEIEIFGNKYTKIDELTHNTLSGRSYQEIIYQIN